MARAPELGAGAGLEQAPPTLRPTHRGTCPKFAQPFPKAQVTEAVWVTQPHHPFSLKLLAIFPHSYRPRSSFLSV